MKTWFMLIYSVFSLPQFYMTQYTCNLEIESSIAKAPLTSLFAL